MHLTTSPESDLDWIKDAVFYQIFPERFSNGNPKNDPENVVPWGSKPTFKNFMGGDLQGILNKVDYLADLGINAIYLNPIFWSSSSHKYNIYDFYKIDPRFGTILEFSQLIQTLHENDMKIILDGVFNHCGRGFFPFYDVMENRQESPYKDWFHINEFPVKAYGNHKYATWANSRALPKFNIENPAVRRFLFEVATYWTKKGIDGWRLDAPKEIEDPNFWREFNCLIKKINPKAYLLGEIWGDGSAWLQGDQFDGVTNYTLRGILLDFFIYESILAEEFVNRLNDLLSKYPWSSTIANYNFLSSHDTSRISTVASGNIDKIMLTALFQFSFPGVPAIYYGDEIGLEGGEDPDNRRSMEWNQSKWNTNLRSFYKKIINTRKQLHPLRHGDWQCIFVENELNLCAFLRRTSNEFAIIFINNGRQAANLSIDLEKWNCPSELIYLDKINKYEIKCKSYKLELVEFPPKTGAILLPSENL